jgi:hypothetical protein
MMRSLLLPNAGKPQAVVLPKSRATTTTSNTTHAPLLTHHAPLATLPLAPKLELKQARRGQSPMRFNAHNVLRVLTRAATIGAISQTTFAKAQTQQKFSARVDVPTTDALNICDQLGVETAKQSLREVDIDISSTEIVCVSEAVGDSYRKDYTDRIPEQVTNCYGDAIGVTARINPGRREFSVEKQNCDELINGALNDGAIFAVEAQCPSDRRKMLFFTTDDQTDYHVVSKGIYDTGWMQKFSGTPRFSASISGEVESNFHYHGIHLIMIVKQDNGSFSEAHRQVSNPYPNWCSPMLCSLPQRAYPPLVFEPALKKQTSTEIEQVPGWF